MMNAGIVCNRRKINATISNAAAFIRNRDEFASFSKYIWSFTDGKPIINNYKSIDEIPAKTDLSDTVSRDMKKRGFKFVGSTVIYAHMQATGMVNDHIISCFRHSEVQQ